MSGHSHGILHSARNRAELKRINRARMADCAPLDRAAAERLCRAGYARLGTWTVIRAGKTRCEYELTQAGEVALREVYKLEDRQLVRADARRLAALRTLVRQACERLPAVIRQAKQHELQCFEESLRGFLGDAAAD